MDIIVENLVKAYGNQRAVDQISFRVNTGEILGFLGPNGAGKTTTMKILTTFLTPDGGTVRIGDYTLDTHPEEIRKHIGYLPENNPLYHEMPVLDYLNFIGSMHALGTRLDSRIGEMVLLCGLDDEKHKKIGELSKGYRQRVGLAQALIHDPEVLILDEPTTGLDPNQIVEIRELIRRIGKQKTVILSSHILAEVEATCDRILIINKGKIAGNGSPEELRKQARGNEILHITIEDADRNAIFTALQSLETVESVDFLSVNPQGFEVISQSGLSSRRAIFNLCVEKSWVLTDMTGHERKLEDVFRELTGNAPAPDRSESHS